MTISFVIGDFELLGSLLSQLKWLISNVVFGDANLLLAHYRDYKSKVPQNVSVSNNNSWTYLFGSKCKQGLYMQWRKSDLG